MFLLCANYCGNAQERSIENAQKEISFFLSQLDAEQNTVVAVYPDIYRHCIYYLHRDVYYSICYDSFLKYDLLTRIITPVIVCGSDKGVKCTNMEDPVIFHGVIDSCYVSEDKSRILIAGDGLSNVVATGTTVCLNTVNGSFLDLEIPANSLQSVNNDLIEVRRSFSCYNPDGKYCSADAGCGYTSYLDFDGNTESIGRIEWQGKSVPLGIFVQFMKEVTDKKNRTYICNLMASRNKRNYLWSDWSKWEECDLILILIPNKHFMLKNRIGDSMLELSINRRLENQQVKPNEHTLQFSCTGKWGNGKNQDCVVGLRKYGSASQQIYIDMEAEREGECLVFELTECN